MRAALRENRWLRHAAFISINLAVALVALELVVFPTHTLLSERDEEIVQQRQQLARLTAMAAQAPTVQKLIEQGGATKDRPEFLRGPNQSVITADLQGQLSRMSQSAGAHVRSIRSLPPQTVDGVTYVGAQVELSGSLRAIQQTVHAIETSTPFLFVMAAAIKPSPQAGFAGAGIATAAGPTLDARLDVVGALAPEERN
jgi:hypothetical protein